MGIKIQWAIQWICEERWKIKWWKNPKVEYWVEGKSKGVIEKVETYILIFVSKLWEAGVEIQRVNDEVVHSVDR